MTKTTRHLGELLNLWTKCQCQGDHCHEEKLKSTGLNETASNDSMLAVIAVDRPTVYDTKNSVEVDAIERHSPKWLCLKIQTDVKMSRANLTMVWATRYLAKRLKGQSLK